MDILLVVILVVFFLGSVALFLPNQFDTEERLPRSKKAEKSGARSNESEVKKSRLVIINPGMVSCAGARKMIDQIYLSTEAPALPLVRCFEKKCLCKYILLDDRRSVAQRRATHEYLGGFIRNHASDRRQYSGRRVTDILA